MSILDRNDIFRKVVEALPVGVWIMDDDGRILYGNPAGQQIWGGTGPGSIGHKGWLFSDGKRFSAEEWVAARAINKERAAIDEEVEIECGDGTHRIVLNSVLPIADDQGRIGGAVLVNHDITARKRTEDLLRGMVDRDPLTNAYNRSSLYDFLESEVLRVQRYGGALSVIMFDIDQFKEINDDLGHVAGDRVLVAIAQLVREQLRGIDRLCRYSGEEFFIIAPGTGLRHAIALAERLRSLIGAASFDTTARVSCSFGVCGCEDDENADALVRRVDDLMYKARRSGRSSVVSE
jgi:diguanylate cyclase (GGDEF)-like protein/PAS domain S-box-containing protein